LDITAVYPGTFDPITNGHVDIATRAAALFDHVIVAVYDRPLKNVLFAARERMEMVETAMQSLANVSVERYACLTVEFARQRNAKAIVRGLRVIADFELEFQMAMMNRQLAPEIESVCLMTSQENYFLSSSTIKEVALLGGDVSNLVPEHVAQALREKMQDLTESEKGNIKLATLGEH